MIKEHYWKDYFKYDPNAMTSLRYKHKMRRGAYFGRTAGKLDNDGNWVVKLGNTIYKIPQIVYELVNKCSVLTGYEVAHKDGNKTNVDAKNLILRRPQ